MAFDRSKFKGSSIAKIKQQDAETRKLVRTDFNRADYHKIEDGMNRFRIYPGQNDETFCLPKVTVWLPQEVDVKGQDGKPTGKKEVKNMPVFNAKVHGGYEKDLVEEYVKFVTLLVTDEIDDEDERKARLLILKNGKKDNNTKISNDTKWVCYADKIENGNKVFGKLEMGKSIKDQINKQAFDEDEDSAIQLDSVSDPDTGRIVKIKKNQNEKDPNKYYEVSLDLTKLSPLTDAELENLSKYDSLTKMFVNSFKRSDFEKQLNGLKLYDDKHGFGAFDHDAWLDICDEISNMIPEDDDAEKESKPSTTKVQEQPAKNVNKPAAKKPAKEVKKNDMFDEMDRAELKSYISENELEIMVKQALSEDDIRVLIRQEVSKSQDEESPFTEEAEEDEEKEVVAEKATTTTSVSSAMKAKLDAMKAKMGKK